MTECQYCGTEEPVYEVELHRRENLTTCIPCLAVKRGQELTSPDGSTYDRELLEANYEAAYSWFTVLARIKQDRQIVKRKEDEEHSIDADTRHFLSGVMGGEMYQKPSEIVGAGTHTAQEIETVEIEEGGNRRLALITPDASFTIEHAPDFETTESGVYRLTRERIIEEGSNG